MLSVSSWRPLHLHPCSSHDPPHEKLLVGLDAGDVVVVSVSLFHPDPPHEQFLVGLEAGGMSCS